MYTDHAYTDTHKGNLNRNKCKENNSKRYICILFCHWLFSCNNKPDDNQITFITCDVFTKKSEYLSKPWSLNWVLTILSLQFLFIVEIRVNRLFPKYMYTSIETLQSLFPSKSFAPWKFYCIPCCKVIFNMNCRSVAKSCPTSIGTIISPW